MVEINRRDFVQSASVLVASGAGLSNVVGASGKGTELTSSDRAGVTNAVDKLIKQGKEEKAVRLLDEANVEHSAVRRYTSGKVERQSEIYTEQNTEQEDDDDGGVGPQTVFSEDDSYVMLSVWEKSGDIYGIWGTTQLSGSESGGFWQYASKADDGFGFEWENDDWEADDPDRDNVETWVNFEGGGDGPDINLKEFDSNHGVAAKLDIDNNAQVGFDTSANMKTDVVNVTQDSHTVPIKWKHQHNSAASETLASVSVGIGPAGLSIDINDVKKQWVMDVTTGDLVVES